MNEAEIQAKEVREVLTGLAVFDTGAVLSIQAREAHSNKVQRWEISAATHLELWKGEFATCRWRLRVKGTFRHDMPNPGLVLDHKHVALLRSTLDDDELCFLRYDSEPLSTATNGVRHIHLNQGEPLFDGFHIQIPTGTLETEWEWEFTLPYLCSDDLRDELKKYFK